MTLKPAETKRIHNA